MIITKKPHETTKKGSYKHNEKVHNKNVCIFYDIYNNYPICVATIGLQIISERTVVEFDDIRPNV